MNPRRVLHVLDTAALRGTAICNIVESLTCGLDPARYRIQVCFLESGPLAEHLQHAGIQSTCVNWNGNARNPQGAARYAALLRSAKFSIIHLHTGGRLLTAMSRLFTRARIVRTLHFRAAEDTGVVPPRCDLPPRDALIAVAQIVADFSRDPRAVVIHPGINGHRFSTARKAHKEMVIGTACRLEPIKGLRYLLDALTALAPEFPDLRLEIAGDGSLRSSLDQESRRLGIADRVTFLGWQPDLPSIMAGWDIFVMPSLDEGFPVAAMEAMAAGLPIVASAVGGLPELVQNGVTGFLVPAAVPAAITQRLRELIQDGRKRQAMGIAGRQHVLGDFPVSRMIEQTLAVYDGLLDEQRTVAESISRPASG